MKLIRLIIVLFSISAISCNNYSDAEVPEVAKGEEESAVDPNSLMDDKPYNDIKILAYLSINDGMDSAFQKASAACINTVKEKDTGTIMYDWYLNDDKSTCVIMEHYANPESVLEHMANVGDDLALLLESSTLKLEVFGNTSDEFRAAFEGLQVDYFSLDSGI